MTATSRTPWLAHRLAQATAAVTTILIVAGGLVTNTGSALAVPDWPTTFGHNMFLFPWAGMVGGIFFEHSHRLVGAVVGLLTVALAAALWPWRGRLRTLGLIAVVLVVAQGLLGGLRVVLLKDTLAILHGCLAQAFFALVTLIALVTADRPRAVPDEPVDATLRVLTGAAVGLVYVQIVFGALITHRSWIELHLVGAVAVLTLVPMVTAALRRSGHRASRPVARLLLGLLALQVLLGAAAFVGRFTSMVVPGGVGVALAIPVLHRLVGALVLASAVALAVRVGWAGASRRSSCRSAAVLSSGVPS